jgi:hypothetical protein
MYGPQGKRCLVLAAGLLVAALCGCEKAVYYGPPAPQPQQPAAERLLLLAIAPANGATGVGEDAVIDATFSAPPDPATVTTASFKLIDEGPPEAVVAATIEPAGPATFRLRPAQPLAIPRHPYRIEIGPGIRTAAGTALDLAGSPATTPCRFLTRAVPDTTPPRFFYFDHRAEAVGPTAVRLRWFPALDGPDGTPSHRLVYAIYAGTESDAIDFGAPRALTSPDFTEHTVGGLAPNTTYYFVIHAIDEAGNEDDNTVLASARTWLAADTTTLVVLYSTDVFGTLEPCG